MSNDDAKIPHPYEINAGDRLLRTSGYCSAVAQPGLQSAQTGELMQALMNAAGFITGAKKDSENPHLKSRYADLGSVYDACKLPLRERGILIVQQTDDTQPPAVLVTTTLHHVPSGQWIASRLRMHAVKADPQAIGSAITYARRYTLSCIAGIVSEDDDGHAASSRNDYAPTQTRASAAKPPPAPPAPPPPPSLAERKAAAMSVLEKNLGAEKAAETLEAIKKQNTTNDKRLAALEAAAALYKDKA